MADSGIERADFTKLSKDGIAAAKKASERKEMDAQIEKSVEKSLKRKDKMPPSSAELKRMERDKKDVMKEDSLYFEKRAIANLKRMATQYVEFFGEKYPAVKKLKKPNESDGKDEWSQYLTDIRAAIGSEKAGEKFDGYLAMLGQGIVKASVMFPEVFRGANLVTPVNLAEVMQSPEFIERIEDEKMEIIFTHESWFASSYWSRFGVALAKAVYSVAEHNKRAYETAAATPEVTEALLRRRQRGAVDE